MDGGWIKLHRKVLDNPLMNRPAYRSVWIELLLRATHNEASVMFKGNRVKLKPGQFTSGAYQISASTGVPRGTVERILKTFKNEEQIEIESDRQCSMITILKWNKYQTSEEQSEERVRNDRGTSEERVRTKQECKNERMKENTGREIVVANAPTPTEIASDFFQNLDQQELLVSAFSTKGIPEDILRKEIQKFIQYWTEPTRNGKRERWQLEKTFEVKRRLVTWFSRIKERTFNNQPKGITL